MRATASGQRRVDLGATHVLRACRTPFARYLGEIGYEESGPAGNPACMAGRRTRTMGRGSPGIGGRGLVRGQRSFPRYPDNRHLLPHRLGSRRGEGSLADGGLRGSI
jgi:hypothetical protein